MIASRDKYAKLLRTSEEDMQVNDSRPRLDHGAGLNTQIRGNLEIGAFLRCGSPSHFDRKCTTPDTNPAGVIARKEKFAKLLCTRDMNMRINEAEKKQKLELSCIDTGVLLNGTLIWLFWTQNQQ